MGIENRIKKIEGIISSKGSNNDVAIYIPLNDKEVLVYSDKIISIDEYQTIKNSWSKEDTIINITEDDEGEY